MTEAENFKSPTPMQKIQRTKSNPQEIKIVRSWISSFVNRRKINKKNVIKIDENGKITIKPMSRISFEPTRHSVNRSMSMDRKVTGYKTRTIGKPIYEDEVLKNLTMEICYEATNINSNSIYIPIKICLDGYNQHELTAYIDSGCFVYFGKRSLFSKFTWKKTKNPLQARIADNSIMSHNEGIEELNIEIGGVQCVIPILWVTNQPSYDMTTHNNIHYIFHVHKLKTK